MCLYFGHKDPLENQLSLSNAFTYPRWLGAILHQMFIVITIKTFHIRQILLCLLDQWLFACQLFLVILKPCFTLAPFLFVITFTPTTWANLIFLGDLVSDFTFGAHMSFILHTLQHLHQPLTHLRNINPLVDYLLHPRHKSMHEY